MKNINDGINNLSQQITGRNKTPQKGTYAQIPTNEDVLLRFDTDKTQNTLPREIKQDTTTLSTYFNSKKKRYEIKSNGC